MNVFNNHIITSFLIIIIVMSFPERGGALIGNKQEPTCTSTLSVRFVSESGDELRYSVKQIDCASDTLYGTIQLIHHGETSTFMFSSGSDIALLVFSLSKKNVDSKFDFNLLSGGSFEKPVAPKIVISSRIKNTTSYAKRYDVTVHNEYSNKEQENEGLAESCSSVLRNILIKSKTLTASSGNFKNLSRHLEKFNVMQSSEFENLIARSGNER